MLHFAFVDGALGYDCVACGSRCCKGMGFAFASEELVPLLTRRPGFAPFLQLARDVVHAMDLEDGCWELAADGRCGIEAAHGRAAKPSTCRLFPTNRLLAFGADLVVDLHVGFCPLVDARTGPRTVIRWEDVARDLEELSVVGLEPRLPPATPDDWLRREAEARDATVGLRPRRVAEVAEAEEAPAWRRFFGLGEDEAAALEPEVAPLLTLALPSLRMQQLTLPGAPPYPKLMRTMDAHLAAAGLLATLAARAGRAATIRGIGELWRGLPLVRELLVRWSQVVKLLEGPAPASAPDVVAEAWRELQARAATRPIGEALAATTLDPPLRPLLLRLASDRMR